jgi:hypothetical protein
MGTGTCAAAREAVTAAQTTISIPARHCPERMLDFIGRPGRLPVPPLVTFAPLLPAPARRSARLSLGKRFIPVNNNFRVTVDLFNDAAFCLRPNIPATSNAYGGMR